MVENSELDRAGLAAGVEAAGLVRAAAPDRYLSALLAPTGSRADLLTLYAFDAELGRIPDLVSEPMLGEIRLQWWRDALSGLFSPSDEAQLTGNPLADGVVSLARKHDLPAGLLHGLVDARSDVIGEARFSDSTALDAYIGKTDGAVVMLAARILGVKPHGVSDLALSAAGHALGLIGMLARLPLDLSHGRCFLPVDALARHHVDLAHIDDAAMRDRFAAAARELVATATQSLTEARDRAVTLDPAAFPAVLPLAPAARQLRQMQAPDFDPLASAVGINPFVRAASMLWSFLRGRIA